MSEEPDKDDQAPRKLSVWSIVASTALAAFGVQRRSAQERDFAQGNPLIFIAAGVIFTALFVLTVMGVVALVLS